MKVQVCNAILSHLSDAQHLMKSFMIEEANQRMNLVKLIVLNYDDTSVYVESAELDKLWEQAKQFK